MTSTLVAVERPRLRDQLTHADDGILAGLDHRTGQAPHGVEGRLGAVEQHPTVGVDTEHVDGDARRQRHGRGQSIHAFSHA